MIKINENLKKYIEEVILPEYELNDKGHNLEHVNYVIGRCFKFAEEVPEINYDMVYTVAAYHDVAAHVDRENHEKLSAQRLMEDLELRKYFNEEDIKIMSEAVEDHRASLKDEPRNIYGKIVSSADRNTKVEQPFKRTYAFKLNRDPNVSLDELIDTCHSVLVRKFGIDGYATKKMYFKDEDYEKYLNDLRRFLNDKDMFRKEYLRLNNINPEEFELNRVRRLCKEVKDLASTYNVDFFFVTEGASVCSVSRNDAVRYHREAQVKWELENGFDPNEDWSNKS